MRTNIMHKRKCVRSEKNSADVKRVAHKAENTRYVYALFAKGVDCTSLIDSFLSEFGYITLRDDQAGISAHRLLASDQAVEKNNFFLLSDDMVDIALLKEEWRSFCAGESQVLRLIKLKQHDKGQAKISSVEKEYIIQ